MPSNPQAWCLSIPLHMLYVAWLCCAGGSLLWIKLFTSKAMPGVALAGGSQCGAVGGNLRVGKPCFSLVFPYRSFIILTWCDNPEDELNWQELLCWQCRTPLSRGNACVMEARQSCCALLVLTGTRTIPGCPALPGASWQGWDLEHVSKLSNICLWIWEIPLCC